jgi:hypothetical protein
MVIPKPGLGSHLLAQKKLTEQPVRILREYLQYKVLTGGLHRVYKDRRSQAIRTG